ncbi:hypothetical protein B296_00050509 [Ensete ventricosum]|uniref:Ent-kaurene oxidase n=1 Tax=Ensete ventricosum TaxID=4639 RepID=A0A426YIJ4_ENSVE|nr:hypothetical protein B296_00050509 [Ensete ventricosum]
MNHFFQAMVTKFSSISTRKLSKALMLLTSNKSMVAMSDYGDFHRMVKRYVLTSLLGTNAQLKCTRILYGIGYQKHNRGYRDTMIRNVLNILHSEVKSDPSRAIEFRTPFQAEIFRLSLKQVIFLQALGQDVESIFVEELGKEMTKKEIFNILVVDPMMGAIEVDWRDFFPYLSWIPNRSFETKIQGMVTRKMAVTRALIMEQKKRRERGEEINCYLDFLLSENTLTEEQLTTLVWEAIIEASDTTVVTTEWAMFELAKNPECQHQIESPLALQDLLYHEIRQVCGSENVTEEHLPQMSYLNAVFHEALRRHSPVPIVPLRYATEDTQLGGFNIQAGSEIAINLYACNMDKMQWEEPEEWKPERFLSDKLEQTDMHKTMAFGAGKRACAGILQAMLISCMAIARFVQEFQWRLKEGEEANVLTVQLTTHKLHPMQAYITPREADSARPQSS